MTLKKKEKREQIAVVSSHRSESSFQKSLQEIPPMCPRQQGKFTLNPDLVILERVWVQDTFTWSLFLVLFFFYHFYKCYFPRERERERKTERESGKARERGEVLVKEGI